MSEVGSWGAPIQAAYYAVIGYVVALFKIALFYFIARTVLFGLIDGVIRRIVDRERSAADGARLARVRTLQGLLRSVVGYVLFFIALVMVLKAFGVDTAAVLTAAGVMGLAVGFGAQRLVRDVISGFFILLENQFAVGEFVTILGVSGTVEEIEMRITRIRDTSGKLNIIANGDITNVCNHSRGSVSASVDISVAPDVDPETVAAVLNEAGGILDKERSEITSPLKYSGVIAMDAAKVTLRFTGACEARSLEDVQMLARERFRDALRAAGIGIL